ncbi:MULTISPECIES: acyl-ACP--UDP-N-acetylglucosamine O-acyltransferase [Alteromonadaceae]|uniref:acyl-ACP--UDP-N-acetylglucosamine O-acyltransferase n=1 Tax=Alteromonadaceae TaxID=72275 RepID=UPI001C0835AE|nr:MULTISPECIES: acyl-ACP--UDP-N-acetylglucosamine O-acyltransferase [unclassified Aliiglaciecola]MBU2879658.1 acyl-ACP--UDP-N-acetylglucosamine O-acyltransferase [Aliiglaciecola lipolytica]MDO6710063.1 acyl-ACP--UDP-N-acetylglucosamine O-acyltransferase [Aliiglaciecola sp. 2_MG-2023]MDO6751211.1 acyl-ACP--UDP-N-acetylglucosamine O-acyltransferase [Aliiglaciecola sp. 1_MG-2023]
MIHETAIVHPSAKLAADVQVGPYSVIGEDVEIGSGTVVESHVVIKGPCTIGKNNRFFQFGSIGEECQDKKYAGEKTRLEIGDNNVFRECVTIHRGTVQDKSLTKIGSNNLFMAYAHVAHDCVVGDDNIFANNATLAGHVHVGNYVILGGNTAVHQFCHIGSNSFTGGGGIILRDIPPFVMINGIDNTPAGINSEGLRRRGYDKEVIMSIKRAYKVLYRNGNRAEEAVQELRKMAETTKEVGLMADFVANSARGIIR